ncbi:uncharacterized protein [Triticum aestivum]|uniref:uncharacterized protein n=1 Tax=Triticum aestivum TaxID=4565 RepID=UPI001ABC9289|nr:uncharacterized protein LOC120976583 [Aegilops tauschii subsp. strangulata]XP_044353195.1 uncharacterized protein LOC123074399 [Triticum aestivum]
MDIIPRTATARLVPLLPGTTSSLLLPDVRFPSERTRHASLIPLVPFPRLEVAGAASPIAGAPPMYAIAALVPSSPDARGPLVKCDSISRTRRWLDLGRRQPELARPPPLPAPLLWTSGERRRAREEEERTSRPHLDLFVEDFSQIGPYTSTPRIFAIVAPIEPPPGENYF